MENQFPCPRKLLGILDTVPQNVVYIISPSKGLLSIPIASCPFFVRLVGYFINRRNNVRAIEEITEQGKRKLEKERAETLAELDHLREYLRGEVDADAEEADPDLYEREKILALIRAFENKLESIEQTLRLAEKGTYGICERCGEKIDPGRLEALPHTTLCVKCKSQMERIAGMGVRPGG